MQGIFLVVFCCFISNVKSVQVGQEMNLLKSYEDSNVEDTYMALDYSSDKELGYLKRMSDFLSAFHGNEEKLQEIYDYVLEINNREVISNETQEDSTVSKECSTAILRTILHVPLPFNGSYARQMLDSWGQRPSGVLLGNFRWWGEYYECVRAEWEDTKGKWCEMHVGQYMVALLGVPVGFSVGGCFPSQCSDEDVLILSQDVLNSNETIIQCAVPPTTLYARDIIAIVVIIILGVLIIIGTIYDLKFSGGNDKRTSSRFLLCFSLYSNTKIIISMKESPGRIACLDGIRFITMTWVILGHTFFFGGYLIDNGRMMTLYSREHLAFMAVGNATFAVDTFFIIGGVLVGYLGMKTITKTKGKINVPLAYLHRYLRLTPAYAFGILLVVSLYRFWGEGPYYNMVSNTLYENCQYNWWYQLLYIGNLYPVDNACFGWGWYLSCDMQFYLLVPFFLMALYRNRVFGLSLLLFFLIANMAIVGSLVGVYEILESSLARLFWGTALKNLADFSYERSMSEVYQTDTYFKPYCRIGVYVIGIATGYLLFQTKMKIKMSKIVVALGWFLSTACALTVLYAIYPSIRDREPMEKWLNVFYQVLQRPLWGASIAWVVVACACGYGGFVNTLLSWKVFIPLSRLTFSAYLMHPLVMYWYGGTSEDPLHFLMGQYVFLYLACLMLSYGVAYILCVGVEWPFANLVKMIMPTPKKRVETPNTKMNAVDVERTPEIEINGKVNESFNENGKNNENGVVLENKNVTEL